MENKFSTLYRVQSTDEKRKPDTLKNIPVKRVLISSCGKIEFNPDEKKYIYFSKTNEHHVYYIFNKIFKIIVEELNKQKASPIYKSIGLPDKIYEYQLYRSMNTSIIRRVKDFFANYIPPKSVESTSLTYLSHMSSFLDKCCVKNKQKGISFAPERSDTNNFGGAYGINDAWLNLLKCCTIQSSTSRITFDKFFDFLLENSHRSTCVRQTLKEVINRNPNFFTFLNTSTYSTLQNPNIIAKNNANDIVASLDEIYNKKLFNQDKNLVKLDFDKVKKELKLDIEELRLEM